MIHRLFELILPLLVIIAGVGLFVAALSLFLTIISVVLP